MAANARIHEVAKMAGVTIGTVSRAFNGYTDIRPETRDRILDAANKVGYTPNVMARSLSSQRPPNIGLILSGLLEADVKDNQAYLILQGVFSYAFESSLQVAVYTTDSAEQRKRSYTAFCRDHMLSGAIVSGITTDDAYMAELVESNIPTVAMDVPLTGGRAGWISIDNRQAALNMGRYLLECGHRRIAVVSGKENAAVSVLRLEGILDAYHDASCPIPQRNILVCDFNESIAYQKTKHFFSSPEGADVTAVFCLSDLMAFGAMRAMRDIGLTVPDDVSIAGFDGLMIGEWITPSLTTVTQDMRRMGYECASLLHGMIRGEETDSHRLLPYVLTKRASVTTNGNVYGK